MNVLGTEYKIIFLNEQTDKMKENGWQGYTDFLKKEIYILVNERDGDTFRHEVVHAFLYESGIDFGMQFHTEECVDWISLQLGKMYVAMHSGLNFK